MRRSKFFLQLLYLALISLSVWFLSPILSIHSERPYPLGKFSPLKYKPELAYPNERLRPPLHSGSKGLHIMGTDHLGRDVYGMWLSGLKSSLKIGLLAAFVSTVLGLIIGLWAGSSRRNTQAKIPWSLRLPLILVFSAIFFTFYLFFTSIGIRYLSILLLVGLSILYSRMVRHPYLTERKSAQSIISKDSTFLFLIEIMEALPPILIFMVFVAQSTKLTPISLAFVMGSLGWMTMARYTRAQYLETSGAKYFQDWVRMKVPPLLTFYRLIIPELRPIIRIIFSYSLAAYIVTESFLHFIGLGIDFNQTTWGSMLQIARRYPSAWWLGIFPTAGIIGTILMILNASKLISFTKKLYSK